MTAAALPRARRMGYRDMFSAGRRILGLLEDRSTLFWLAVGAGVLAGLLTVAVPLLVREIFLRLEGRQALLTIEMAVAALVVIHLVRGALRQANVQLTSLIGYDVARRARVRLYEHLTRLSMGFLSRQETGTLMARAMGDCDTFDMFLYRSVPVAAVAVTVPVAMAGVLLALDAPLALVAIAFAPLSALILLGFASEIRIRVQAHRDRYAEVSAFFHEALTGLPLIKSFHREGAILARIRAKAEQYRDSVLWVLRVGGLPMSLSEGTAAVALTVIVLLGARHVLDQTITLGDYFVFVLYSLYFFEPIRELNQVSGRFQNAVQGAQRVFRLLDTRPDVVDANDAIAPADLRSDVEFRDVGFGYEPGRTVLREVSFEVRRGEVVALVGPSGSGKTTLAYLAARFYDPQQGKVLLGGIDLRRLAQPFLRRRMAMVLQDVFLFNESIRENIRLGREDASDAEVEAAARAANLHDFVATLPDGYDTLVGERAVRLSGGERQRLSIARALVKDAPILILDEATSSVDAESEHLIQQAIARLTRGRTVLVIAHRLSTIRRADRIVVLDAGRIVEQGRHEELMALGGRYASAYLAQQRAREWRLGVQG